tara:strand:+ start:74354 stop:74878 length:525 start_codon:yes stop_codon:yes gene_type:complete
MEMEKIKVGLLGVIAITLIANTVIVSNKDSIDQGRLVGRVNQAPAAPIASPALPANNNIAPEAPSAPAGPSTTINFSETEHTFGKINQDSENTKIFSFTNTGSEPLIIQKATGSCGCTVPKFPKEPIAPGATGEIEVVYKPGKQKGSQQKTVTVTANTEPAQTMLYIKAEVQEI